MKKEKVCPRCGERYSDPPALSRADNKTPVCPKCGTIEAFIAYGFTPERAAELQAEMMKSWEEHIKTHPEPKEKTLEQVLFERRANSAK